MSKITRKIEVAANISIIIVAVLIAGTVIQRYFFKTPSPKPVAQAQPQPGTKVSLPDFSWSDSSRTLVLALQKGCRYCTESAPFFKRLKEEVKGKNIKLVAALPGQVEESRSYLREIGLSDLEVRQSSLDNLQVAGTPTIILVNDKGEVVNYWVGKLPNSKEEEVVSKLNS